jgi:hypothetical protein
MRTRYQETDRSLLLKRGVTDRICADGGSTSISIDEAFSVLANSTRRHVLAYLREAEGPVERQTLVRHVAARELDSEPDDVTTTDLDRTSTRLHHLTLPSLREKGLVGYDDDAVWPTQTDPKIDRLLDAVSDDL